MNAAAIASTEPSAECRIYVACLASYNNGRLYGRWIDVDGKDADELREDVAEMLRGSPCPNVEVDCPACDGGADEPAVPGSMCMTCEGSGKVPSAEEFAIHDHEGFGRMVGEYTSLDDVAAIAEALTGGDALAFRWLVEDRSYSAAAAAEKAEDVRLFQSEGWNLAAEYAEDLAHDIYTEEELGPLASYIDWERYARDLKLGGDIDEAEIDGERFIVTNANEF